MRINPRAACTALIAAVVLCSAASAWAQDAASGTRTKPAMMAADANPDWEVVTVKPADPNATSDYLDQYGRRLKFANKTVEMLLSAGYNVHKSQIANVPEWVKTQHWDIDGLSNMDGRMNMAQL